MDLPYVDEHSLTVTAPRERVWRALERYATETIGVSPTHPAALLLGTRPASGFEVSAVVPGVRIDLTGQHRFSRYALVLDLRDAPGGGTWLRATTYAAFPGWHGRVYRALVIDSRVHVLATTGMLRTIARDVSA